LLAATLTALLIMVRVLARGSAFLGGGLEYWDSGQFLQATHNLATTGIPWITLEGFDRDYFTIHRNISAHLLAWLYRAIPRPELLWAWQGVGLLIPGLLMMAWVRPRLRANPDTGASPDAVVYLSSVFFLWIFSPVVTSQFYWAYQFHIFGLTLIGLGLLAWLRRLDWAWFLCFALAALEKEDFGIPCGTFALLNFMGWIRPRSATRWASLATAAVCFGSFIEFSWFQTSVNQAEHYFSNWGTSYSAAGFALLRRPFEAVWRVLHWKSLVYFGFFTVMSGLWLDPASRRGRLAVLASIVPIAVAQALSNSDALVSVRHHYALPLLLFSLFALLKADAEVHSAPTTAPILRALSIRNFKIMAVMSLFLVQNPIRAYFNRADVDEKRAKVLAALQAVAAEPERPVCCAPGTCSLLAQRRFLYSTLKGCPEGDLVKVSLDYAGERLVGVLIEDPLAKIGGPGL